MKSPWKLKPKFVALGCLTCASLLHAGTATITIDAAKPGPRLNPGMYGIFLEEINHGVDGGLYAELIRNRGFEDANPLLSTCTAFVGEPSGAPSMDTAPGASIPEVMVPGAMFAGAMVPVICAAGSVPTRLLAVFAKKAYGEGVSGCRGGSVVKLPPPFVRTLISSQRSGPLNTPAPRSTFAMNRPLLTARFCTGVGPASGVPVTLVVNTANVMSYKPLAGSPPRSRRP